jgi:hypothetical protein
MILAQIHTHVETDLKPRRMCTIMIIYLQSY